MTQVVEGLAQGPEFNPIRGQKKKPFINGGRNSPGCWLCLASDSMAGRSKSFGWRSSWSSLETLEDPNGLS